MSNNAYNISHHTLKMPQHYFWKVKSLNFISSL